MLTHEQMIAKMLENPAVRAEYERIEREEMPALDAVLKARKDSGMSQTDIARAMGVSPPVVSRLENALITGKHSPSIATLRRYAAAMGKRLEFRFA
jgi:predicted transcriptional regulator